MPLRLALRMILTMQARTELRWFSQRSAGGTAPSSRSTHRARRESTRSRTQSRSRRKRTSPITKLLATLKQRTHVILLLILLTLAAAAAGAYATVHADQRLDSPSASQIVTLAPSASPALQAVDLYVSLAVDEFFPDPAYQSEVRMITHCLLYRESHHASLEGHGDGGLAGGPLQFHQPTWEEYRQIMIDRGLAHDIGSRYDLQEAIRTTVWAIKDGRASAWGPILRAMQGQTEATCPTPSWY